MMLDLAPGWTSEVARGPDWLFVKLHGPDNGAPRNVELADSVWKLMQQHLLRRVVIELDDLELLRSDLLGQLLNLHDRISSSGGLLRLSGVSDAAKQVLRITRVDAKLPVYANRDEAIYGERPAKPR